MFNLKEWNIILDALFCRMHDVSFNRYLGGDISIAACELTNDIVSITERIVYIIGEADVEANSQEPAAALPKRTASNLDQRGAGDEVSLDQHIQLYKEVF